MRMNPVLSPLVLGFWRAKHWGYSPAELLSFVEQAADLGVTTMDHAMVYRSEALFGEALASRPSLRHQLSIVSKCGIRPQGFGELGASAVNHYDFSAEHTRQSVEASLSALRTDYLDLLLLHRPDFLMDVGEVADIFSRLKAEGKVKHFGVSNFAPSQFALLQSALPDPLLTNQVECSPLHLAPLIDGTFDQAQQVSAKPMLWSCLGGGRLFAPTNPREKAVVEALQIVAAEHDGSSLEAIAYAWLRALPCQPHPILGTSNIERVKAAVEGLTITLSREQWYRIWEASNGAPVP